MCRQNKLGFSLVELMVVVGIVGVVSSIAVPRYNAFISTARRGEGKGHLHTLHMLQSSYFAEHQSYYSGLKVGYIFAGGTGDVFCDDKDGTDIDLDNKLGFRPHGCTTLRYGYSSDSSGTVEAFGPSVSGRYIYPDCDGGGDIECNRDQGDALMASIASGSPTVCRNINKYCPQPLAPGTVAPPPPPLTYLYTALRVYKHLFTRLYTESLS